MNLKTSIYCLVSILLFFSSCSSEKQELIDKYKEVYQLVHENKYDLFHEELDEKSKAFVTFFTDTTNLNYPEVKRFGGKNNLLLFATTYHKQWGNVLKKDVDTQHAFFAYLGMTGVSMFNWLEKPRLLEKETGIGKENYVLVGIRANENTFITSKVHFTKNGQGEWKLDLLSLLSLKEKILKQAFQNFVQRSQRSGEEIEGDILLHYLNKVNTSEYIPTSFRYNSKAVN